MPWGPRPYGRMILTKGGHITNFRVAEGRTPPKTATTAFPAAVNGRLDRPLPRDRQGSFH